MATINRRRPRAPKAKPKEAGLDAHVGRLRHLLDAQLRLAEALEWEPKRYRVLDDKDPRKTGCVRIHIDC